MTDTSQPIDRVTFCGLVENGRGDGTVVSRVSQCTLRLPETTSAMLGVPDNATFATGAAKITARLTAGKVCPLLA